MKKKMIAGMLSMALILTAGCGSADTTTDTTVSTEISTETTAQTSAETSTETREEASNEAGTDIVAVPTFDEVTLPENEALDFVKNLQLGWNLGNTFDAIGTVDNEMDLESYWAGVTTTREHIQTIAEAGFQTIRIPVSWHNHVDENYQISQAWLDRVQEVVDWSLEEGLYVILNIHHDNEVGFLYPSYDTLEQSQSYVASIWTQLAERFAEYDERLVFETMNEPRQTETDHEWWIDVNSEIGKECIDCVNILNQTAVNAIRENGQGYNTSRYILAPGYCASPDFALTEAYVLPTDELATAENRILVSVHAYTPYNFALASPSDSNSTDVFSIENKIGTRDIDSFMKKLYNKFVSEGVGVVIGEFGARDKDNNLEARTEYAAYYVACARHYGITTCWWDNNAFTGTGENFGLLRRRANTILYPAIVEQMVYYSVEQ